MDLLTCLFDRTFLETVARQFRAEAEEISASGLARPILYEQPGSSADGGVPTAQGALKPQTINEFRKARIDMGEPSIQLGRLFESDAAADAMWVLQYKFYVVLYLSDSLMTLMQEGSPKPVNDQFLRHFRSYFERHICGVGSASKKKGVVKTMLVNTEPIDFVISESLRLSRLCNAR
jgi:hypothetical protein